MREWFVKKILINTLPMKPRKKHQKTKCLYIMTITHLTLQHETHGTGFEI